MEESTYYSTDWLEEIDRKFWQARIRQLRHELRQKMREEPHQEPRQEVRQSALSQQFLFDPTRPRPKPLSAPNPGTN